MVTIIRYMLFTFLVLIIPFCITTIRNVLLIIDASESILIFERYYADGGDHSERTNYYYAVGFVNNSESEVCIGYEPAYEVKYYADSLNNLKQGDKIEIWHNKEYNRAWLRIKGRSKEDEINIIILENGLYVAIYIVALSIFEYLYRKQKKLKSLDQIYSTLKIIIV